MMLTQENQPIPVPGVDPTTLQALMCQAGIAVAVLDGAECLSMLSRSLEHLLQRPFAPVPAELLAEVFHLYSEGGDRLLLPQEVPIVRASRGEVVKDAIITVKTPGQPVRHLRVSAAPVLGADGGRKGAWAVMTDFTTLVAELPDHVLVVREGNLSQREALSRSKRLSVRVGSNVPKSGQGPWPSGQDS